MSSAFTNSDGIVLREVKYKEADRILTILTSDYGKITAKAPGALRKNSKLSASTQLLTYSDMSFYANKGRTTVKEAQIKEDFKDLRLNFKDYALGCYFAECIEMTTQENAPDKKLLQLLLNSLYALSRKMHNPLMIKAAFEMRLISLMGYTPDVERCPVCGKIKADEPMLCIETGHICCRYCYNSSFGMVEHLDDMSLEAIKKTISSGAKSFIPEDLNGESLKYFSDASEKYFVNHNGRYPGTLDYWKKL